MKKAKWLIYTVVIGLVPFLIRTLIVLFSKDGTIDYWLNETDFIIFGLVLNLTNINELEDKEFSEDDKLWKTINIGLSVVFITLFAAIFMFITYADFKSDPDINTFTIKTSSILLSVVSFLFSYSIYNRLNTLKWKG